MLDNPDVVKWIKPNELVLTSGYLLMDDEARQRQLIRDLRQVGCSALCVKTRRFFQSIPEAMLQESERVGLPLIELPFFYSFSDISRVIFQRLFLQNSSRARGEQRLLMALGNALFSGADLTRMLRCFVRQYRTSVLLISRSGVCLDAAFAEGGELRLPTRFHPFTMPPSGETVTLACGDRPRPFLCVELPGGFGGLFFPAEAAHPLRGDLMALQHGAMLLSLKLEQTRLQRLSSSERDGSFLSLLTDAPEDLSDEEIIHICALHHFDYQKKRLCVAFFPQDGAPDPLPELLPALEEAAGTLGGRAGFPLDHLLCADRDRGCLFLLCDVSVSNPELTAQARALLALLAERLPAEVLARLRIGVGYCHHSVASIPGALRECAEVVRMMSAIFPERGVFFAASNTVYQLLSQLPPGELRRIYLNTIAGLAEYDRANGTEFLKTLQVFYAHQFNASRAARELYVHRNTILHRLEKIREILRCDFQNTDDLMAIYLGICVSEMLG